MKTLIRLIRCKLNAAAAKFIHRRKLPLLLIIWTSSLLWKIALARRTINTYRMRWVTKPQTVNTHNWATFQNFKQTQNILCFCMVLVSMWVHGAHKHFTHSLRHLNIKVRFKCLMILVLIIIRINDNIVLLFFYF